MSANELPVTVMILYVNLRVGDWLFSSVIMADQQQYFLKWNDYQSNMVSSFKHLRNEKSFTDVTLACEGQTCKAHKMVLSACSPYFKALLEVSPIISVKEPPDFQKNLIERTQFNSCSFGLMAVYLSSRLQYINGLRTNRFIGFNEYECQHCLTRVPIVPYCHEQLVRF